MNPSVEDSALHVVAVHVWKNLLLSSETVAMVTDNSTSICNVQKIDVEEEIAQESGVRLLQKLLGPIQFTIVCVHCIYPRIHLNSTRQHA